MDGLSVFQLEHEMNGDQYAHELSIETPSHSRSLSFYPLSPLHACTHAWMHMHKHAGTHTRAHTHTHTHMHLTHNLIKEVDCTGFKVSRVGYL